MIARARLLKAVEPKAKVVFIGPCLAKRAESKRPELSDAVDLVLTYKETFEMLQAANINPEEDLEIDVRGFDEASHDGRIYARSGGVTEAISKAVRELKPHMEIKGVKGNGLKECTSLLEALEIENVEANFMEGMACPGGCVGGPGTIIDHDKGCILAQQFAELSSSDRASANGYAMDLMEQYGNNIDLGSVKASLRV
jgi:iron only hydrogenase large subunit-like protein